jgi:hypothetical protein
MYNVPPDVAGFWLLFHETASIIGFAFRTVAGFMATVSIVYSIFSQDFSKTEALTTLKWVLLGEAIYAFSLLPAGLMTIPPFISRIYLPFFIETGIPCLIQSIIIPLVFTKLVIELNPKKPINGAIKWGLISATAYIFSVFWLNNTTNWIYTIMEKGWGYVIDYPLNMFSFLATTFGLLAFTLYSAYFSKKSFATQNIKKLRIRHLGAIVTISGLYFLGIYMMWIFFGSVGGWSTWYAWFLGHNMDLWIVSIPFVGLPLLLQNKNWLLYLIQGIGVVFLTVFVAAYLFALPSLGVLHQEPVFSLLLSVFGGILLLSICLSPFLLKLIKK